MIMMSVSLAISSEGSICKDRALMYCCVNNEMEKRYHAVSAQEMADENHHGSFSGEEIGEHDFCAIIVENLIFANHLKRFGGYDVSHDN